MPKKIYQITTSIKENIKAEDEQDAIRRFFEDIESEPQQSIASFLEEHLIVKIKPAGDGCWAQVGEHWCKNKTIKGSDYCKKHTIEFDKI